MKVGQFEEIVKTIAEILPVTVEGCRQMDLGFLIPVEEGKKLGAQQSDILWERVSRGSFRSLCFVEEVNDDDARISDGDAEQRHDIQ